MTWFRTSSKFGAKRVEKAGLSFASKAESALHDYLLWMEKAGEIREIQCQDTIYLTDARIIYKPDFKFWSVNLKRWEWAEFKGHETTDWRIKRKLWIHYGPGRLYIYKGSAAKVMLHEVLEGSESQG